MNVNWANHTGTFKIEPQQLIAYIEKHGWIYHNFWPNRPEVRIYQKIVDGGMYQITVPMTRELADYNSVMLKNVIEIINSNEGKEVKKLTAKILAINCENKKAE
jgi:hypothetical protein